MLLYIERWLKVPLENSQGEQIARTKGTPQGGVISPLLANLFMHYAFDKWMEINFSDMPFARYADDLVIFCKNIIQLENSIKVLRNWSKLNVKNPAHRPISHLIA